MNFGIDYDGCANSNISMFLDIIFAVQARGHNVYIVTMRYPSECAEIITYFGPFVNGIIPTSREAKKDACDSLGINIHVWMDDHPRTIGENAMQIWGMSTPEGVIHAVDHTTGGVAEGKVVPLIDYSGLMIPIMNPVYSATPEVVE